MHVQSSIFKDRAEAYLMSVNEKEGEDPGGGTILPPEVFGGGMGIETYSLKG